jgi:hypothetical protein
MHPKQRPVKFTTVLMPFLCFAVERRGKNKFCLPLSRRDVTLKFLLRKENVNGADLSVLFMQATNAVLANLAI